MSLTWHIVKKDLRRMALPAAAWVAFVGLVPIWYRCTHMPEEAVAAMELWRWHNGVRDVVHFAMWMQLITGVLLAGNLVLEDPVIDTTAFWPTRPIARGRLLAAKSIGGVVLFVAAPTLARALGWWANGLSIGEMAATAGEFSLGQMWLLAWALGLAALTRTVAQFFFGAVGVMCVFWLCTAPVFAMGDAGVGLEKSRQWLTLLLPLPGMVLILAWQFLTQRTRLGWVLVSGGLVALCAVRNFWPLDLVELLPVDWRAEWPVARSGEKFSAGTVVKKIVTPFDKDLPHALLLSVRGGPVANGFLAPLSGQARLRFTAEGPIALSLTQGGFWGEDAAQRIAGLKPDSGPIEWGMAARFQDPQDWSGAAGEPRFEGDLRWMWMRGRVLAELPLVAGAQAREGASAIRIVGIGEGVSFERPCVVVEERDATFVRHVGFTAQRWVRAADETRQDCYLLVNRRLGFVRCLQIVEVGSPRLDSMRIDVRQLEFSVPDKAADVMRGELAGWRKGAVLIKVRFELERRIVREVTTDHVPLEWEGEKK